MKIKSSLILAILVILSLAATAAYADGVIASISNPKMILYYNVTPDKPLIFQNSIKINNKNEFPVFVKLSSMDDMLDIVTFDQANTTLQPGESKALNYTITIVRPKVYKGDIVAAFLKDENQSVAGALAQTLIIAVKPADGYENAVFPTTTTLAGNDNKGNGTSTITLPTLPGSLPSNSSGSTTLANTTTTKASGNGNSGKTNPWIGLAIFAVIIAVGIGIYFIITMAGGRK